MFAAVLPSALALRGETMEERGKKLMDKLVNALGGNQFLNMRDRTEEGRAYSFYREELSGLSMVHIYTQYPAKAGPGDFPAVRERQAFGKNLDDAIIFADGGAHEVTFRGARPLPDERLRRFVETTRRNIFYIVRQRLHEPGMIFESPGGEMLDNFPVQVLNITDSENRMVKVYLDHLTFLPVRQSFQLMDPILKERREEVTRYNKYRPVKGVMWPFDIQRERDGEKIFQMFSENVSINNNLADKMFSLPSGIKILKKEA
jgi:hypothetical protein